MYNELNAPGSDDGRARPLARPEERGHDVEARGTRASRVRAAPRHSRTACGAGSRPTANASAGVTRTPRARASAAKPSPRHGSGSRSQR